MITNLAEWLDAHPNVKEVPGADLYVVATRPLPTDAAMVQGCLVASGVPAMLSDANMVQAYAGAVTGFGGVRIMVAARYLQQAIDVLAAYDRGEFALDESADVGTMAPDAEHDTSRGSSR
jgi:Zn-dependent alcohol dehydrogenase